MISAPVRFNSQSGPVHLRSLSCFKKVARDSLSLSLHRHTRTQKHGRFRSPTTTSVSSFASRSQLLFRDSEDMLNEDEKAVVKDGNQTYDHRFQRTDQWMPVYSWLESLNTDEVIKSKDVLDWLTANKEISEQLYSRHSRYHLMHYIKKCHVKILKRKEKQGLIAKAKIPPKVEQKREVKESVSLHYAGHDLSNMPKDGDIYKAKQTEALRKYQLLLELEKQLMPLFGKRESN